MSKYAKAAETKKTQHSTEAGNGILLRLRCVDQVDDTYRTPKGKGAFVSARDFEAIKINRRNINVETTELIRTFNATTSSGLELMYAL